MDVKFFYAEESNEEMSTQENICFPELIKEHSYCYYAEANEIGATDDDVTDNDITISPKLVLKAMHNLLEKSLLCDAAIIAAEGSTVAVHSLILAAVSPLLQMHIVNGQRIFRFPDIRMDVIKALIQLLYTGGELKDITDKEEFLRAAKIMHINLIELQPKEKEQNKSPTKGDSDKVIMNKSLTLPSSPCFSKTSSLGTRPKSQNVSQKTGVSKQSENQWSTNHIILHKPYSPRNIIWEEENLNKQIRINYKQEHNANDAYIHVEGNKTEQGDVSITWGDEIEVLEDDVLEVEMDFNDSSQSDDNSLHENPLINDGAGDNGPTKTVLIQDGNSTLQLINPTSNGLKPGESVLRKGLVLDLLSQTHAKYEEKHEDPGRLLNTKKPWDCNTTASNKTGKNSQSSFQMHKDISESLPTKAIGPKKDQFSASNKTDRNLTSSFQMHKDISESLPTKAKGPKTDQFSASHKTERNLTSSFQMHKDISKRLPTKAIGPKKDQFSASNKTDGNFRSSFQMHKEISESLPKKAKIPIKDQFSINLNDPFLWHIAGNEIPKVLLYKAYCFLCADECLTEKQVLCYLCMETVMRSEFMEHVHEKHKNCPTKMFWFRCRNINSKQNDLNQHKVIGRVAKVKYDENKFSYDCALCEEKKCSIVELRIHLKEKHNQANPSNCRYCFDVLHTKQFRCYHEKFCGNHYMLTDQGGKCLKCSKVFQLGYDFLNHTIMCTARYTPGFKHELLRNIFVLYSQSQRPISTENFPLLEHGGPDANPNQNSVCFRCSALKKSCQAKTMKCLICFQILESSKLDEHMNEWHSFLKGSQPFTCVISALMRTAGFRGTIIGGTTKENESLVYVNFTDTFTCFHCEKVYRSKEEFTDHCSETDSCNLYFCNNCPVIFKTKKAQVQHEFFCNGGGVVHCKHCNMFFTSFKLFNQHSKSVHFKSLFRSSKRKEKPKKPNPTRMKRIIKCELCKKFHATAVERYMQHLQRVHGRSYFCKHCFLIFETSKMKKQHFELMHVEKMHLCPFCGKRYHRKFSMRTHIATAHPTESVINTEIEKQINTEI